MNILTKRNRCKMSNENRISKLAEYIPFDTNGNTIDINGGDILVTFKYVPMINDRDDNLLLEVIVSNYLTDIHDSYCVYSKGDLIGVWEVIINEVNILLEY